MAKLFTMFIVLIAIQGVLLIYNDATATPNVIWEFVNNLNQWGTLTFVLALVGISGGIYLTGVAAASLFGFKTDFLIFAPAIAGFVSIGAVLSQLANVIQSDLVSHIFTSCDLATRTNCNPVYLIVALTVGPIALLYVWTVVEWWRNKDFG